jgi:hypothetical protein
MFDFPHSTIVNRPIPKSKILERARPTTRLKELLTHQIQQILWYAKLAPETIRIPSTPQVPEIQIFHLQLKGKELHPDLLELLDKTIPQPIIFTIETSERKLAHSAAHKRPSEADSSQWVVGSRFTSDYTPLENITSLPLPAALDLSRLYTALLAPLLPLAPRRAEPLPDLIERCGAHQSLQRKIALLTSKVNREKQFNRRVTLNLELNALRAEIDAITASH